MSDRTKRVVPESGRGNVSWGDDPAFSATVLRITAG